MGYHTLLELDYETRSAVPISHPDYYSHPSTEITEVQWCVRTPEGRSTTRVWSPFGMFVEDYKQLALHHVPDPTVLARPATTAPAIPQELWQLINDPGVLIAAFNKKFEIKITFHHFHERYGANVVTPDRWLCRAEQSRWMGGPGNLEDAAAFWSRGKVRKSDQRALQAIMAPQADGTWCSDRATWLEMWKYGGGDIPAQMAVDGGCYGQHPALHGTDDEKAYIRVNDAMNARGIPIARDMIEPTVELVAYGKEPLVAECQRLTAAYQQTLFDEGRAKDTRAVRDGGPGKNKPAKPAAGIRPSQVEQIKLYLQDVHGYPHDGLGKEFLQPWVEEHHEDSDAYRVGMARMLVGKAASSKYEAALERSRPDDHFVRDALLIFGAHTRRSSSIGLQAQNFFRPTDKRLTGGNKGYDALVGWCHDVIKYPGWDLEHKAKVLTDYFGKSLPEILANLLRGMIRAPEGAMMFGADYSAIEARITFWLAGCVSAINVFNTGGDIYCETGTGIFGRTITKADEDERFLSKTAVLGLGFGMGCPTFTKGLPDHLAHMAPIAYDGYHSMYPEVKALHNQFDCAAIAVFTGQHERVRLHTCDVAFERFGEHVRMVLPSGGHIIYPFAKAHSDPDGYQWYKYRVDRNGRLQPQRSQKGEGFRLSYWRRWEGGRPAVKDLGNWGGKWLENCAQSLAGDIMFAGTMQVEEAGVFKPFLPIHDELLNLCYNVGRPVEEMVKLLEEQLVPSRPWMTNEDGLTLPLDAEGWAGLSFRK